MVDGLADLVIKDFTRNTMTKRIVVDLKGLTAEQKAGVLKRIQHGTSGVKPATPKDIFIVE